MSGAANSTGAEAPDTTVCIFVWNEAETLAEVIGDVSAMLKEDAAKHGRTYEVIIIDDGSRDGSEAIADEAAARLPHVRVVHHPENLGLGPVYRTGFEQARGHFLSFVPGDGQFPAALVRELREHGDTHDLVLGYLPDRADVVGKTLSAVERLVYRVLVGRVPRFQGLFMVRTEVLRRLTLQSRGRGWAIVMEMLLRFDRAGHRIRSIPQRNRPRRVGTSKVNNLRTIRANVAQLAALRRMIRGS
jgi:glycosyltransferase involved in cell wall biosynthesis